MGMLIFCRVVVRGWETYDAAGDAEGDYRLDCVDHGRDLENYHEQDASEATFLDHVSCIGGEVYCRPATLYVRPNLIPDPASSSPTPRKALEKRQSQHTWTYFSPQNSCHKSRHPSAKEHIP
jgi:hypothetical protein